MRINILNEDRASEDKFKKDLNTQRIKRKVLRDLEIAINDIIMQYDLFEELPAEEAQKLVDIAARDIKNSLESFK